MDAASYWRWTVPKLKAELSVRGAATTGRKADLIDRLEAYDRNRNVQPPPIDIPDPAAVQWPVSGYRQLIPEHRQLLPKVTREQIEGYFLYRLAGDKQVNGDIKALQKGRSLLDSKRVLACSLFIQDDGFFLSGIVGAAMKKQVCYNFKLKIERQSCSPVNSQCECPAGKGPNATCKHIAAVVLMLEAFSETGELQVQKSCTQDLQTFHKPRSHYNGAPVKIESIPMKRKLDDILEDPRPEKFRKMEGYTDFVRNVMVNYCAHTSQDLALRYIFPPANIQAAQHDHDYLSLPYAEYWIDHALSVTEEKAKEIEQRTKGQSDNKRWILERQWRLTASKFGEISRITPRRQIPKLCRSIACPKPLNTPAVHHGKMYEQKAIGKFEEKFKVKTQKCGLFVSLNKPFLGASPDAVIGEDGVVEVKCPYAGRHNEIIPGPKFKFLEFDNCRNISLKKSSLYYDQIQGQMFLSNRNFCFFVVYTFKDLFVQKIDIDREYCIGCLLPKLEAFYVKHFRPFLASLL